MKQQFGLKCSDVRAGYLRCISGAFVGALKWFLTGVCSQPLPDLPPKENMKWTQNALASYLQFLSEEGIEELDATEYYSLLYKILQRDCLNISR